MGPRNLRVQVDEHSHSLQEHCTKIGPVQKMARHLLVAEFTGECP